MSRYREYNHAKTCEHCGSQFHASRFDARYCGGKCRQAARRAALKRDAAIRQIKRLLGDVLRETALEDVDALADDFQAVIDRHRVAVIK